MVDSRESGIRFFVLFCAIAASLGTLNSGFNTSALNIPGDYVRYCPNVPTGTVTYYPNSPLPQCIPMDAWIWGVATGMFAIGGLVGAMIAGPMANKFGRRDSMIMINATFIIGAILLSTATSSAQFAIGRIFVGIGGGFMTVVVSMYITETSPPKYRGALTSFLQLFMTIGILVIECIGLGLRSSIGWRVVVVITVVPAIVQALLLPLAARSPRWLIGQNRIDEARAELLRLRNGDIEEEFADMVLSQTKGSDVMEGDKPKEEEITDSNNNEDKNNIDDNRAGDRDSAAGFHQDDVANDQSNETPSAESRVSLNIFQVMSIPVLAKLTIKMMILHAMSQLTGINAIMYYSTTIFQDLFGDTAPYVTVGVAALNFVITFLAVNLVDRLGRKFLLCASALGMCIFSALEVVGTRFHIGAFQVVCIMLFVASFAIGLGIIPFVITAECYPTYAVGAAVSAALVVNWLCNFIIGLIFPTLQAACGPYVFLIFTGLALFTFVFLLLFIPETKQKSIERIGRELGWYGIKPELVMKKAHEEHIA